MINIIDRYIAKAFIGYFLAGLSVVVTLFIAFDFMSNFARFSEATSLAQLAEYYLLYAPSVLYQMVPVGCLMATVFTLSSLSKSGEMTALFSLGMGLARVSAPVLVLVALVSGSAFLLGDRVLPWLAEKRNYVFYVEIRKQPELFSTVKTNKIWYRSGNILFNIKTLQPERNTAEGVTLYYFDVDWNLLQMISARRVQILGEQWKLSGGTITVFPEQKASPVTQVFEEKLVQMQEKTEDLQARADSSEVMSLAELRQFVRRNQEAGLNTLQYEVQYHAKFGFAFAAFVMSCLGVPFCVARSRSGGTFANIGICLGLAFLYWAVYSSAQTLASHGHLHPLASAWLPNFVFFGLAVGLIHRTRY